MNTLFVTEHFHANTAITISSQQLLFVLDQLADITSTTPETPHEQHFQDTYGSQISAALSCLREPESYFDPQSALLGLRQLHQVSAAGTVSETLAMTFYIRH